MESVKNRDPIEVFISYAHEDEEFRQELETHLSVLQREGTISAWHDRQIQPGSEWSSEIDSHLHTAHIILLMVSADFLHSDYCYAEEMQSALERHDNNSAKVIPIILRPSDWMNSPLGKLKALPKNGDPVTRWTNRDEAFLDIVRGLRAVIDQITTSKLVHDHQEAVGDCHKVSGEEEVSPPIGRRWIFDTGARLLAKKNLIPVIGILLFILFVLYIGLQLVPKNPSPIEGRITRITSDLIELNIGSEDGVVEGLTLIVFGQVEEIEGDVLVGQLRVKHVETRQSTAEVLERTAPFRKGWKVQEQQP